MASRGTLDFSSWMDQCQNVAVQVYCFLVSQSKLA